MAQLRRPGPLMRPVHVSIEPTNVCNALCPVCETGKGDMQRNIGFMDFKNYCDLIDEIAPTTSVLLFYFMGEPFLNKNAYKMIKYARERNIFVETCTNGDLVDPKKLLWSDISKISFQIGGLTPEIHSRYRVNSDLLRVQSNLLRLIELRRESNSRIIIEVGFIVMRHNEHQVDAFLEWAESVGVDVANIIDPCARNMIEAHAYLPKDRKYWFYNEEAFNQGYLIPKVIPQNSCTWIWNSIQVNWDGTVVPCCRDTNGKHVLGNIFEDGIDKVFNSTQSIDFRSKILKSQGDIDICRLCSGYGLPSLEHSIPQEFNARNHSVNS